MHTYIYILHTRVHTDCCVLPGLRRTATTGACLCAAAGITCMTWVPAVCTLMHSRLRVMQVEDRIRCALPEVYAISCSAHALPLGLCVYHCCQNSQARAELEVSVGHLGFRLQVAGVGPS
jgi:hypothetical protein